MIRLIRFFLLTFLVFIIFSSCNRSSKKENPKPNLPDIEEYYPDGTISPQRLKVYNDLFSPILKKTNFNGSVLVALNGYIIYQYNKGYANFENSSPITDSTLFQIASLTKMFTSSAIMLLVEENKISLDDTVSKYLNNIIYKDVTIRQLLQHRSGLPRYEFFENEFWLGVSRDYNKCVLNKLNSDSIPYYFKPNSRFLYSNTGYLVLATIIEKVSNMSYEDFLAQRIFIPSNMRNTSFSTCNGKFDSKRIALGYYTNRPRSGRWEINAMDSVLGDKGMYSTSLDLLNWYRSLYHKRVISQESIDQIQNIIPNNRTKDRGYGLGIRWKRVDERDFYYHNGRWNGFRSSFVFRPDTKLLVIALSNTSHSSSRIANSIIDTYDKEIKNLKIKGNKGDEED